MDSVVVAAAYGLPATADFGMPAADRDLRWSEVAIGQRVAQPVPGTVERRIVGLAAFADVPTADRTRVSAPVRSP